MDQSIVSCSQFVRTQTSVPSPFLRAFVSAYTPRAPQYTFTDSRIVDYSVYNNDASSVDFTLDNDAVSFTSEGLQLELTKANGGPRILATRLVHYGLIEARMRTGKWQGVITSFITFSAVRDEIDIEFVGTDEAFQVSR